MNELDCLKSQGRPPNVMSLSFDLFYKAIIDDSIIPFVMINSFDVLTVKCSNNYEV